MHKLPALSVLFFAAALLVIAFTDGSTLATVLGGVLLPIGIGQTIWAFRQQ